MVSAIEGVFHALKFNISFAFCLVLRRLERIYNYMLSRYCPTVIVWFLSVYISLHNDWDTMDRRDTVINVANVRCHECPECHVVSRDVVLCHQVITPVTGTHFYACELQPHRRFLLNFGVSNDLLNILH